MYVKYALILMALVAGTEFLVMNIFIITGLDHTISIQLEAFLDAFLLLLIAATPVYYLVIKPIVKTSRDDLLRLESLACALEGSGDAVLITDKSCRITFVNQAFTTITGFLKKEVIGKSPRLLQSGKQDKLFYQAMWSAINGSGGWQGEIVNRRKNGEEYTEHLHIRVIYDDKDRVAAYIGSFCDISALKKREQVMRQAQKMEALGTLVGGVAHNFNNLLGGILGQAYLAELASNQPKVVDHIGKVKCIANDAAQIVHQLLSFSHQRSTQKKNTPVVLLLKETAKTLQLGIKEDITLVMDFTSESLVIYCDPVEIQQVVMNLVNNARDAVEGSSRREITLKVDRGEWKACPRRNACSVCTSEVAQISIEDTGSGISAADLERVFEPFFTTKEVGKGTGLGLSMAKGVIESHCGTINVSSQLGVGTKIEICIPLVSSPADAEEKQEVVVKSKKHETILLMDDEEIVRETLAQILKSLGYTVLTAADGEDGVRQFVANKEKVSLVISDVIMPRLNGPLAIKQIREIAPNLPVI